MRPCCNDQPGLAASIVLVVALAMIRRILAGCIHRALVGIDPDVEDLGAADDLDLIDPALFGMFELGMRGLAVHMLFGHGDGLGQGYLGVGNGQRVVLGAPIGGIGHGAGCGHAKGQQGNLGIAVHGVSPQETQDLRKGQRRQQDLALHEPGPWAAMRQSGGICTHHGGAGARSRHQCGPPIKLLFS